MTLAPKLALRQSAQLVMTPQLQQAIKLLQLSNQELSTFIEGEIQENPLLEREDAEGGFDREEDNSDATEGANSGSVDGSDDEPAPRDAADLASSESLPESGDAPLDTDYANDLTNDERAPEQFADWGVGGSTGTSGGGFDGEGFGLEDRLSEDPTLRDHLSFQINVSIDSPAERVIAMTLTDTLDAAGYLTAGIDEIAERLGVDGDTVARVLEQCQRFDPAGVYARDLSECLALQLKERDRFDPAMATLVDNLELLAKRDIGALKKLCRVDDEDFAGMVAEIRALDPKPGLVFEADTTQAVVPDIMVRPRADGSWQIELNADTLPRVLVNQSYYAEVRGAARSKADHDYLSDRMASANWLVRALHQRATTILKVATEIVRSQGDFLTKGVQHLKPLTLRDVADAIGMHESTVSRVTTAKFMATPRGVFELKYFFTTAIASMQGGEAHSAEAVRHRIRDLIEHETARAVLSDDKIVQILSREGIDIARRTVAKYRETLHIPSSSQRRREKAISL